MVKAKGRRQQVRVLVLSGYPAEAYGLRMMRMGASGYLDKCCAPREIVAAVRRIGAGGRYITPRIAELLARDVLRRLPLAPDQPGPGGACLH